MEHHNNAGSDEVSRQGCKNMFALLAILLFVMAFRIAVMERIIVNGNSMYPTLASSDVCMVLKLNISPQRYDIAIARVGGQTIIKRVIGLPGETLQIIDGKVYIDGQAVSEEYDFFTEEPGLLENPYTVGANEYFLMGDNRAGSYDSRNFGSVGIKNIKGIVLCRIYPFWYSSL